MEQTWNQITYQIRKPFDFSFLKRYGEVFRVFDQQDSGCICFGVQNGEERLFVKFAGAPTIRYQGKREDAVSELKSAAKVYEDLRHDTLVSYLYGEEIGGGFAAVFRWTDAECMGKQYSSRYKFFALPAAERMGIFRDIVLFHQFIAEQGYVAVDFYDGSILYDFAQKKTILCDVDLYAKRPYVNTMGRMWGSSRFMAPEEFTLGAEIDEVTNVYLMGATAFALFGGADSSRRREDWDAVESLWDVARRAVSERKEERYSSICEFYSAWEAAGADFKYFNNSHFIK